MHLFKHVTGAPVRCHQVIDVMRQALTYMGLDPQVYSGHSFRIGHCTDVALEGRSDAQLRHAGRWASNAFQVYTKLNFINC